MTITLSTEELDKFQKELIKGCESAKDIEDMESTINILFDNLLIVSKKKKICCRFRKRVEKGIIEILERPNNPYEYIPKLLDTKKSIKKDKEAFETHQYRMKKGDIWEFAIGKAFGWTYINDGIDCINYELNIYLEVKRSWNSMNANARKGVIQTLVEYKKVDEERICIIGYVNTKIPNTSYVKESYHNGFLIKEMYGWALLDFVFTFNGINYAKEAVAIVVGIIEEYESKHPSL